MLTNTTAADRDAESRNRIVSETGLNMFVEAGAGSGKTTMLVRRMVAMVEQGIPIETISAITFTRAAAGEFYDRFQQLLTERSRPDGNPVSSGRPGELPPPTPETRERCARALQNIDLCFLGTIDSFCARILSEHPSEAGISSDSATILAGEAEQLYLRQYAPICDGKYGEELAELARSFRALHWDPREVYLRGVSVLMENRNVTFHFPEARGKDIDPACLEYRSQLLKALRCLAENPDLKYIGNKDSRNAWEELDRLYRRVQGDWGDRLADVMYALKQIQKLRLQPDALPSHEEELGSLFVPGGKKGKWLELRKTDILPRLEQFQYSLTMTFLSRCVPVLEKALRAEGCMTFFDSLYTLRNMLKKDAEGNGALIRSIYARHSHFLIDEFQDTNPLQAEIFFYLTAEYPRPRWSDCVPRPGSLFIVGDPKQSIYRFRGADVTSFLRVRALFQRCGGAVLTLSRNFRSSRSLCSFYNQVFRAAMPAETENQSRFEEIPLPDEDRTGEFQGVWKYSPVLSGPRGQDKDKDKDKDKEQDPGPEDQDDPSMILRILLTLTGREEYQIRERPDSAPRQIRYGDIMVITPRKADLGPIMARLHEMGIPARVEGDVPFPENEALREVWRIYAAVADPDNPRALTAGLTGRLMGLTLEDLMQYRARGGSLSLRKDSRVARVEEKLNELRALAARARLMSPAALFSEILDSLQVYTVAEPDHLEVVFYCLELLRAAEQSGAVVSLKDGSDFLQRRLDDLSEEERCLSLTENPDCVHLANLHKVKGLEAPVVILAAAKDAVFPPGIRIVHGDSGSDGFLFSLQNNPVNGRRTTLISTTLFGEEQEQEAAAMDAERLRLVYVAATRARSALVIADPGTDSNKWALLLDSGVPRPLPLVPLETACPADTACRTEDVSALYQKAENGSIFRNRTAETASYQIENPSRLHLVSRVRKDLEQDVTADLIPVEDSTEPERPEEPPRTAEPKIHRAVLGTMVHKLMEVLVTSRNRADARSLVDEILREYRSPETEPLEKEIREILRSVAKTMRGGGYPQTNGAPQDILNVLLSAEEVYCEVPFSLRQESGGQEIVWNGVMDVVYLSGGKWHILDYKTSSDGDDLDVRYQAQLQAYITALHASTGQDADALIYHIPA